MYEANLPAKPTNAKSIATALKRTCAPKAAITILRHALASSDEAGTLTLTTTDLEVSQTVTVPGVDGPATPFVVDLDKLHKMAGVGGVAIAPAEGGCTITAGTITAKSSTPPVEEWPRALQFTEEVPNFPVHRFAEMVPAMSRDTARPILCGLYLTADGEIASTDFYRLYRIRTGQPLDVGEHGMIVPGALVREIIRHKPSEAVTARVTADGRYVSVTIGTTTLTGRVVGGDFPNYNGIMPEESTTGLALSFSSDAPATLRNLSKLVKDEAPVKFTAADGRITGTVTAQDDAVYTADFGTADDIVEPVAFNTGFLADLLDGSAGKVLQGVDHLKPWATFDGDVARLLMPVRCS